MLLPLLAGCVGTALLLGGIAVLCRPLLDAWLFGRWQTTYGPVCCDRCGSGQPPIVVCADGVWRCARCCAAEGWDVTTGHEQEDADVWELDGGDYSDPQTP